MTNKTQQAEETRRMAEALRGMYSKMNAAEDMFDSGGSYVFDTIEEYLGEELDVLFDILISRLGFSEYEHDGDNPMFEIVFDYATGGIEYEDVLASVAESHELHEILIFGDEYEYPAKEGV